MRRRRFHRSISRIICVCLIAAIGLAFVPSRDVKADAVTDTLTVAVGYWGMDLSDYAIAGTYFWGDLEAELPMYEQVYSYFQSGSDTEYVAIVDSAYGFLVRDLLDYANINFGDIYNLQFYVVDHNGIQAAFDTGSLFGPRYYFDNVALHRKVQYGTKEVTKTRTVSVPKEVTHEVTREEIETVPHEVEKEVETEIETEVQSVDAEGNPIFDEEGNPVMETITMTVTETVTDIEYETVVNTITETVTETIYEDVTETYTETVTDYTKVLGYSFDECWNYCERVEPMLALFDSWVGYSQEFESIGPNFEAMSSNNRFRLLFGQTSPTETLTSSSAKYVSRVYVTLYGSPVIGEMPELDNTLGSHEVTVQVKVDDVSLINALSEYMRVNSSDESVMRVTGLDFYGVEGYSDLMNVRIRYEIVGNGTASFTASFGGRTETINMTQQVEVTEAKPAQGPESSSENPTDGQAETESTLPSEGSSTPGQQENVSTAANANGNVNSTESVQQPENLTITDIHDADTVIDAEELQEPTVELTPQKAAGFLLSDKKAGYLNETLNGHQENDREQFAEAKDITQVKLEDSSEDKEERQKKILLWTGIAAAFLCLAGASTEIITFRRRLRRS